jgi:hypothetical protein
MVASFHKIMGVSDEKVESILIRIEKIKDEQKGVDFINQHFVGAEREVALMMFAVLSYIEWDNQRIQEERKAFYGDM